MLSGRIVQKRIDELTKDRDQFIAQVNVEVAFKNGEIKALQSLLQPVENPKPAESPDTPIDVEIE